MKCNKCNSEVAEGAKFCANCGNNVEWQTMALDEAECNEVACPQPMCPHCGNAIDSQTVFCGYCGKNISEPSGNAEAVQIEENAGVQKVPACEKCGTPLVEGAAFCGGCGNVIGGAASPEAYAPEAYAPQAVEPELNNEDAYQYNGGYVEPAVQNNTGKNQGMDKGLIILLAILAVAVIIFAVVVVLAFNTKPATVIPTPDITDAKLLKSAFAFAKVK